MKRTCFTADIVSHSKNSFLPIAIRNSLKWIFEGSNVQLFVFMCIKEKVRGKLMLIRKRHMTVNV